ncbi:MAG: formyltransferase family protein [bacterium]
MSNENTDKKRLLIFASGTADPKVGGTGARKLLEGMRSGELEAIPAGLVSNHEFGSIYELAKEFGVPFFYSPKGRTAADYQRFVRETKADYVACSGWLGKVEGLDPKTTFNIHPAYLPSRYGGRGMHGDHVHNAVWNDYIGDDDSQKPGFHGMTLHFMTEDYDCPDYRIFTRKVYFLPTDAKMEDVKARVRALEEKHQVPVTNLVVTGKIHWDGIKGHPVIGADIE